MLGKKLGSTSTYIMTTILLDQDHFFHFILWKWGKGHLYTSNIPLLPCDKSTFDESYGLVPIVNNTS